MEAHLRRAIELAMQARRRGNRPFGAVVVDAGGAVLAEAEADNNITGDCTGHAETNALRIATRKHARETLAGCTLYSSAEPCVMCAGAIFWSNIRRLVYGIDAVTLRDYRGEVAAQKDLQMSCRDVFRASPHAIDVVGPCLEDEARVPHEGFWK
jgi:tRNA(adenine34) deaminase